MLSRRVVINEIPITCTPATDRTVNLRIAHVSDFHFRRWNAVAEAAQQRLMACEFDFLVTTGDLVARPRQWQRTVPLVRRFFEPFADRVPVFGVLGNHDPPDMAADGVLPFRILRNESITINCRGVTFELAGVDQSSLDAEDLHRALPDTKPAPLTILLAHYPSTVFRLPPGRVDVQLSGHTHGGQIRLPGLGCVWPNDRIPRGMARGLHHVQGTTLYVTAGLGVSPPIHARFNCPPEVSILQLLSRAGANRVSSLEAGTSGE